MSIILSFLLGCSTRPGADWQLVFQNDLNGGSVGGSRRALADALRRGSPIRVAWGETLPDGRSVVEFAVPEFISLMADSEVVVQFPGHILQTNYVDANRAYLRTEPPPTVWRALMSTDGHYHQFHYDLRSREITRIMYARTAMHWYAFVPPNDDRPIPELATLGAFALDSLWGR